jgi:hypothetical protein
MSARYLLPSMALDGPTVIEHSGGPDTPDAVRVLFANGGWVWVDDPANARALAAAFTEAAERLDAMRASKVVAA